MTMLSTRTRPRRWRWTAAVGGLLLLLGACAPVEDDSEEATDEDGSDGDADQEEADRDDLDEEAPFRYAYTLGPTRFDPHLATSSFDAVSLFPTYDRLIHLTPEAEFEPGLAEDWEFTDDETRLELQLREDVTFHDGEPFDAEAVAANLERAMTVEGSAVAGELEPVEDVEVVDEHEVVLHLAEPHAALLGILSDRAGMMISPAAFDNDDLDQQPVGAGMYEVAEYRPDDVIVFEPAEDYWDPEAVHPGGMELHIMQDDTTRMNAIRTDELDATFVNPPYIEEAEQLQDIDLEVGSSLAFLHLQLNRERSEFGDPRVRKAINYAINRQDIVDGVHFGYAQPAVQPFPEEYWAHNDDVGVEDYEHDPDRARELLEEAGLEDGFSFELLLPTVPDHVQVGEVLQSQLAEVGIEVEPRSVEPAQVSDIFYAQQESDAMLATWGGRPDPSMTTGLLYTEGFANPGGHTTETIVDLHRQALATSDREEREEIFDDLVEEIVIEESMGSILYFTAPASLTRDDVVGVQSWLSGKPEFRGAGVLRE